MFRVTVTMSLRASPQTGVAIRFPLLYVSFEECNKEMQYYVYILTNKTGTTMYIGVTKDLVRRVYEHRHKLDPNSFTAKYDIHKLVYYESHKYVKDAILREKKLKGLLRIRKNELVETMNPEWIDLSGKLFPNVFT